MVFSPSPSVAYGASFLPEEAFNSCVHLTYKSKFETIKSSSERNFVMETLVRDALVSDLAKIAEIESRSFSTPWSENAFASQLTADSVFKVLTADGKIVGYAVIDTQVLPESELFNIAVDPKYRGKGFSKLLMDAALAEVIQRGAETVLLEVRASNAAAIGLYEKYGFKQNGVRKGYYSQPKEDAVLMCARIMRA